MKEYKREYPIFSLCGLNCGLCPRYQTEGKSRCPGCGGGDFHLIHPTCAVITCNQKHDHAEFCFQCSSYLCDRYARSSDADSFITYRNVRSDFEKAQQYGIERYTAELKEKMAILECLIKNYNDGRSKNFYCIAVNLLELDALRDVMAEVAEFTEGDGSLPSEKVKLIRSLLEAQAAKAGLEIKLRK